MEWDPTGVDLIHILVPYGESIKKYTQITLIIIKENPLDTIMKSTCSKLKLNWIDKLGSCLIHGVAGSLRSLL